MSYNRHDRLRSYFYAQKIVISLNSNNDKTLKNDLKADRQSALCLNGCEHRPILVGDVKNYLTMSISGALEGAARWMNAATVCVICNSISLQSFIIFVCEAVLDTVHFPRELSRTSLLSSASQAPKRDVQLTTRLRCARQYPTIYARTNRYKNSFILLGLNHLQWCDFVYPWFSCMFA